MQEAETLLLKARSQLLMQEPFFGTLAMRLKLKAAPEVGTAATDGSYFFYDPEWIQKQNVMQLRGLFAHEVMHCALNHNTRRQERDAELWNISCDYAINPIVIDAGLVLPDKGCIDDKLRNMPAEQIYNLLNEGVIKKPRQCKWGAVLDAGKHSVNNKSTAQEEVEWQLAVAEAAEVAKQRGKLPGALERFISDIVNPKVDWREVLWPFFTDLAFDDYSWTKPNRAYISEDEYLPSMRSEGCGKIAVVHDTSGSTHAHAQQFFSELDAVLGQVQPEEVVFIECDCQVQDVRIFQRGDRLEPSDCKRKGDGGTEFTPAFKLLHDEHPDVDAVIFLTDLETGDDDFYESEQYVTSPVLWVSTNRHLQAPFGITCYL